MNAIQKEVAMALIAVVNDDPDYLEMMRDLLEDIGYQAFFLSRASDAYEVIERHCPDLVLADVRMEKLGSGIHLVQKLRQNAPTHDIPVIMVTADIFFLETYAEWIEAHNCAVLVKPFQIEELEDLIERMLSESNR